MSNESSDIKLSNIMEDCISVKCAGRKAQVFQAKISIIRCWDQQQSKSVAFCKARMEECTFPKISTLENTDRRWSYKKKTFSRNETKIGSVNIVNSDRKYAEVQLNNVSVRLQFDPQIRSSASTEDYFAFVSSSDNFRRAAQHRLRVLGI